MRKSIMRRPLSKSEWLLFLAPLTILLALGIYTVLRPLFPREISVSKGRIQSLTYSPDGKQLAVISNKAPSTSPKKGDGAWLSIYDTKSASQLWQQEVGDWSSDFLYSQDGKVFGLYSTIKRGQGSTDFRDSQSRQILYRLPYTDGYVFSRDGSMLLARTDPNLTLYDNSGNPLHTFNRNLLSSHIKAWSWSPFQKLVAALEIYSQDQETVRPCIWDVNGKVLVHLPARKWTFIGFAADERYLILGEESQPSWNGDSLQLWDWRKGEKIRVISQDHTVFLGISRDNTALIAKGNELRRLSLLNNKVLWSTKKQSATVAYFTDSKDRLLLSEERVKSGRNRALLWNYQTGKILQTYEDVSAMAISPDGATVAIGKRDGKRDGAIQLYNSSRFLK